jgi:hypothetical protein
MMSEVGGKREEVRGLREEVRGNRGNNKRAGL